jgi:hypothetical protein
MQSHRNVVWATIVVAALTVALVLVQHVAATTLSARTTYLTFNRSVQLPGVTLEAGTYIFELADPFGGSGVVRVLSRDRRIPYFMGLTNRVDAPRGLRLDASVLLAESAPGVAPRITAWFPIAASTGRQFMYSDR